MKMRIVLVLAVLMLAAPVWAEVLITCTQVGDTNEIEISYDATGEPNFVRALALNITSDAAAITAVTDLDPNFDIFPGSIVIVDGNVTDYGTPIADKNDYAPGSAAYNGTLGGLGTGGVTIEMGSLNDVPVMSGKICSVFVDCNDTHIAVEQNAVRGGVVLEDPEVTFDFNSPGVDVTCGDNGCFPTDPAYAVQRATWDAYVANGWDANCWCAAPEGSGYQCDGDADGADSGAFFYYRVYTGDLNMVMNNWRKKQNTAANNGADPCADTDHRDSGPFFYYCVYTGDLNTVMNNWRKKDSNLAGDCPRDDASMGL